MKRLLPIALLALSLNAQTADKPASKQVDNSLGNSSSACQPVNSSTKNNSQPSTAYAPFDLGELKPEGWLRDWARLAARGMTRKIGEDFTEFRRGWADPDQGGWWHYEQTAYYTDGFTRLGFLLDDTVLINRSRRVMEAVMARQKPNGYIHSNNKSYVDGWGTTDIDYGLYWSEGLFCRAAIAYYTATHDQRIIQMLRKVYHDFPLFSPKGKHPFNGGDLDDMRRLSGLEAMFELTRLTGDHYFADRALQVLSNYEQAYIGTWVKDRNFLRTAMCHGVTYNEASKLPAIAYIWNGNPDYLAASVNSYEFMQTHSMLPNGCNSSNEFLHGIGAFEANESCDISDFMWSNIWMARATGDRRYGDRIERDCFNALPGAVNSTFTQSLYTQAVNRIPGFHLKIRDDGNYYKEMHWPTCCPANLNRALPNYISHMALHNADTLLWLTYGPARLQTRDSLIDIECETDYPFRDRLTFHINRAPQNLVLKLRIPEWCDNPAIEVQGLNTTRAKGLKSSRIPKPYTVSNGYYIVNLNTPSPNSQITLTLPMRPQLVTGREHFPAYKGRKAPSWGMMAGTDYEHGLDGFIDGGSYAYVNYGPLLFGMSMQERPGDYFDINEELWHEFRYALDAHSLDSCKVDFQGSKVNSSTKNNSQFSIFNSQFSWSLANAPLSISANASLIEWEPDKGDPVLPEQTPVVRQRNITIRLLPYGFMAYRIAMFPLIGN